MESDVSGSGGSPRERQGTSRVGAGCFPDTHRPNSGTPHPVRLCGLHTRRRLLQCPTRLPERSPAQRAQRARTWRFTSAQGSPEAGFFSRFAFLRASSCFCQSWTGTASGAAARSSHRSSTSWSFSEGLRSKIDAEFIRVSTANSRKSPGHLVVTPPNRGFDGRTRSLSRNPLRTSKHRTGTRRAGLNGGLVRALYFGHDFLDCGAFQPAIAVTGVVARARSIDAEKAGETVQPQFALQNREGMPLEVFIARLFKGDHCATSRYQDTGFWTRMRSSLRYRPARQSRASSVVGNTSAWPCSALAKCKASNVSDPSV